MYLNLPAPLKTLVKYMLACKEYLLFVGSLILALTFFCVVILRYWFQADLFADEEWILMIAFWVYFLGGAMGSYENTHVKADFLLSIIHNPKTKWMINNAVVLIEVIVGLVLCYWAFLMLNEELQNYPNWQRTTGLGLPFFIPKLGIFLGFVFMTFYTSLHLYSHFRDGPPASADNDSAKEVH